MNKKQQIEEIIREIQRIVDKQWNYTAECSCASRENIEVELQPELQDLLLASRKYLPPTILFEKMMLTYKYNLKLSFLENLENDELTSFIHNLICK